MPHSSGSDTTADDVNCVSSADRRRVLIALYRFTGDLDLAEDACQEALVAASAQWPIQGVPTHRVGWLIATGKHKAIDARRRVRDLTTEAAILELETDEAEPEPDRLADDDLRLICMCCHPSLSADARIALTLREVCGLTTEEVAHALLIPTATLAQRLVRAKAKIKAAGIPFEVPTVPDLPDRLESILCVIYLVFNEGYSASAGANVVRADLAEEAIRLARLVHSLIPEPEVKGLLALLLLQHSRRHARTNASGDLILLDDQDRGRWDRDLIREGLALINAAFSGGEVGSYALQAGIAGAHAASSQPSETDWGQIVRLYDLLLQIEPSPVVRLNRAVAVAKRDGPEAGLQLIDELVEEPTLSGYHLAHAARADLAVRAGRTADAESAYRVALSLALNEPERRFLTARLNNLKNSSGKI